VLRDRALSIPEDVHASLGLDMQEMAQLRLLLDKILIASGEV